MITSATRPAFKSRATNDHAKRPAPLLMCEREVASLLRLDDEHAIYWLCRFRREKRLPFAMLAGRRVWRHADVLRFIDTL